MTMKLNSELLGYAQHSTSLKNLRLKWIFHQLSKQLIVQHAMTILGVILDDDLATLSQGLLCGVCGQHNYQPGNDDFTLADGTNYIIEMIAGFPHVEQAFYDHYVQVDNPPK